MLLPYCASAHFFSLTGLTSLGDLYSGGTSLVTIFYSTYWVTSTGSPLFFYSFSVAPFPSFSVSSINGYRYHCCIPFHLSPVPSTGPSLLYQFHLSSLTGASITGITFAGYQPLHNSSIYLQLHPLTSTSIITIYNGYTVML